MSLNHNEPKACCLTLTSQRGFSIVSAIFLLVVLSALGAFMLTFSTVQHTTSAQDLQGTRAYQAARAGIEWGSYQALIVPACVGSTTLPALAGTLATFTVVVQCAATPYTEGNVSGTIFTITSTATTQGAAVGSINYVQRQLQATLGN